MDVKDDKKAPQNVYSKYINAHAHPHMHTPTCIPPHAHPHTVHMNSEENDLINIMSLKDIITTNDINNIYYLLSFINLLGQWDF